MSFIPLLNTPISKAKVRELSPLALAYIGDSVHTLYVRQTLAIITGMKPSSLHKKVTNLVKASAQAEKMQLIIPYLTEEELEFYHHGRNAKVGTIAKHASVADYMQATGFETLVGYLYLTGQTNRLEELLKIGEED